jgi:PAS domain S-box-containing protein
LANLPTNVYWKDKNSVYMGCNNRLAMSMGLKNKNDIVGMRDFDFLWSKEEAESFISFDRQVMKYGLPITTEDSFCEHDGKRVIVLTNKTPLRDSNGVVVGVLAISVDITEKKKLEDELINAKKEAEYSSNAKSEFIANMSHDLRTPMTGLLGMLNNLLFATEDVNKAITSGESLTKEKLHFILNDLVKTVEYTASLAKESATNLNQLHNDILDNIELESGKTKETPTEFNLDKLIQSVISLQKPVAEDKKLKLTAEIEEFTPCHLKGLSQSLKRMFLNLIGNALKFTEQGSVFVSIGLDEKEKAYHVGEEVRLKIQVKDTGIGIPSDKFDEIFGQFSRLSASYEGVHKGLGLGLYVVKQYADAMKGTIRVESQVGEGTCFTLSLPFTIEKEGTTQLYGDTSETPTRELSLKDEESRPPGWKVLLVEDDKIAAIAIRMTLTKLGCQVDWAQSGEEALEKSVTHNYSLIFMDIGLPQKSGIEVTREIRGLREKKKAGVPIIALTGHARGKIRKVCLDAGMQQVLSKPATPEDLRKALDYFSAM